MNPKRSTQDEIIKSIFDCLDTKEKKTITDISRETEMDHKTIKKYLEIITEIQSGPKIIIETTGHSYQIYLVKKNNDAHTKQPMK